MTTLYLLTSVVDEVPVAPSGLGEAQYLSALIGVVLPILVGLVTKYSTAPKVRAILLLALSLVSAFLTEMLRDANFNWQQAAFGALLTFVIGVATQYGLWAPTGVSRAAKLALVKDKPPSGDLRGNAA